MSSPSFMRFVDLQVLLPKPAATSPPEGSQTTLQDRVEDAGGLPPSDDEHSRAVQRRCHQLKYTATEKVYTILVHNSFLSVWWTVNYYVMQTRVEIAQRYITGDFRRGHTLNDSWYDMTLDARCLSGTGAWEICLNLFARLGNGDPKANPRCFYLSVGLKMWLNRLCTAVITRNQKWFVNQS